MKDRLGPVSRGASSPVNSRCMRDKDRDISRKNRKTRDRKGGRNKVKYWVSFVKVKIDSITGD